MGKTKQNLSSRYVQHSLIMLQSKYACFLRNSFFSRVKNEYNTLLLNVLTDPIILSVHFTNRM